MGSAPEVPSVLGSGSWYQPGSRAWLAEGSNGSHPDRAASPRLGGQITAAWGREGGCSACSRGTLPPPDASPKPAATPSRRPFLPQGCPFPSESFHISRWPMLCGVLGRR